MSQPSLQSARDEAVWEITRSWLNEYGKEPTPEELEMEYEAMCEGG